MFVNELDLTEEMCQNDTDAVFLPQDNYLMDSFVNCS